MFLLKRTIGLILWVCALCLYIFEIVSSAICLDPICPHVSVSISLCTVLRMHHFQILGSKLLEEQRVGEVSVRSGRGKHTTRHVSLLPLSGGGYLADTPGFNQPSLLKVTTQSLAQTFPEVCAVYPNYALTFVHIKFWTYSEFICFNCQLKIRKLLSANEPEKCSFNDCLHLGEPGCVVKGDWERYPYYFQLLDEIKIREEFQLRTLGTKREGDVRYVWRVYDLEFVS